MRTIDAIILHHSATDDIGLAGLRRELAARNLPDAYHVGIERDGRVRILRPFDEVGTHDRGENAHSVGVCLIGQYAKSWDAPPYNGPVPEPQLQAALAVVVDLCRVFSVPLERVRGHGEDEPPHSPTLCPGIDMTAFRCLLREHPDWEVAA